MLSNPEAAFELIEEFLPSLRKDALELMVITIQTQVALGYLGVAFIQSAQVRQNLLLTVDRRHETPTSAAHFARHAISFMALVAIPYMLERTLMENGALHLCYFCQQGGKEFANTKSVSNW